MGLQISSKIVSDDLLINVADSWNVTKPALQSFKDTRNSWDNTQTVIAAFGFLTSAVVNELNRLKLRFAALAVGHAGMAASIVALTAATSTLVTDSKTLCKKLLGDLRRMSPACSTEARRSN